MARADLHVHSKHSNQPTEWILRQFRAPESFTEPREIYRICRERGMDFVTISDHDSIDGALEIAHLPGTFLSCEVTAEFPEDRCEIHCLVLGLTEAQHREIQELRRNLYELRDYLRENGLLASVAHPLFRVNGRLTLEHFEKLLVLFDRFETLNGMHDRRLNGLARQILSSLSPEAIEHLAGKHRLEPWGPTPWIKSFTGGSDDHGGLYIATTWTETREAATVEEYLAHLGTGRHDAGGETGSTLRLVRSLYTLAHEYYRRQFPFLLGHRKDPFAQLLQALALPRPEPRRSWLRTRLESWRRSGPSERSPEAPDRVLFGSANRALRKHLSSMLRGVVYNALRGRLSDSLAAVSHLAPLALSLAPYLVSVHALHKDADLLDQASLRFLGRRPEEARRGRRAWFTEDLAASDGVGETLQASSRELVAVTCGANRVPPGLAGLAVRAFPPLLKVPMPREGWSRRARRRLVVPPLLEVLDHCERERYSEILIDTPGPLGLAGLAAGKLLGIPVTGIYRTDLPAVARPSGSPTLDEAAWAYLRWFFGQADTVYVARGADRELLVRHGFDPARLALLSGELQSDLFEMGRRIVA